MKPGDEDLIVEPRGDATIIWFNRPDRLNAFRTSTFDALGRVLDRLAGESSGGPVILSGRGRGFCAGEDLREMGEIADGGFEIGAARSQIRHLQDLSRTLLAFPRTTVAAINGPAVGFGAELPLACGVRIAAESAYFLFPEAARGMLQTNGTFSLLPRIVGQGRACEWLVTARRIGAAEALDAGLVSATVPGERLIELAVEWARRLGPAARVRREAVRSGS